MTAPTEEMFDVVDNRDRVIGQMARSEVHRQKLLHRAVHIFLFRSDGRMLVHLRTDSKEEFPSVWTSSASGHVSAGETYAETAPRELKEELGVEASTTYVLKVAACRETSHEFTELFLAHSDQPVSADPIEIADVKWLLPAQISTLLQQSPDDFSPAFRLLFHLWNSAEESATSSQG